MNQRKAMREAANHSGIYTYPINKRTYPRVQILTVAELLAGKHPALPANTLLPYFQAQRRHSTGEQLDLGI